MYILVINSGSSTVKIDLIHAKTEEKVFAWIADKVLSDEVTVIDENKNVTACPNISGHAEVLEFLFGLAEKYFEQYPLVAVGHRVAHGGEECKMPTYITDEVEQIIQKYAELVPLHNPAALAGVKAAKKKFPNLPCIAVFDTSFHQTLPRRAVTYPFPKEINEKYRIRRFGFHGTSHRFVCEKAAEYLNTDKENLRIVSCHLGNGASIAAVEFGRSVDTSMGITPIEGMLMGTRSGDIDPGILLDIMEKENMSPKDARDMLNTRSGLKGLTGTSDMREIEKLAAEGNDDARLAIYVFAHRLRKYIGAYAAVMGGVDAIVLTGGIGENSAMIRHRGLQRLDFLGAVIDEEKNHDAAVSIRKPVFEISASWSRCKILVVRTDEQLAIAKECRALLEKEHDIQFAKKIPVAVSARHVHLTQAHVEVLFGKGYHLQNEKELSQPGNFACRETVTLVGPKNNIENVRILGPCRNYSQVEISRTDEFLLGIDAPVRASGHIENTPGMTILGTDGRKLHLDKGVICAWRHIHINDKDAALFGVKDKDVISVEINNKQGRSLIFGDVLIRVDPAFVLEMHIDTDEANAAEIHSGDFGLLVETNAEAQMQSKKA